jgi:two-component system osmolarity sensor histidine kinase EnvZ
LTSRWPRTLFSRTSVLIAATLSAFAILVWQAAMWTVVVPAADLSANILAQRAKAAIAAYHSNNPLPEGTRIEKIEPRALEWSFRGFAFGAYLTNVRRALQHTLPDSQIVVTRFRAPSEVWIRSPDVPVGWLVLSWRVATPQAPMAALGVLIVAILLVLGVSAWSARRLAAPLANLAAGAARLAEGDSISVDTSVGPAEVRSLAIAFQSMAHRLAELESQRELLLAGVSHDLRSPLARMRVAVELLDARDAALAEQMSLDIEEMDRMIGQFLHYARAGYQETPARAVLDQVVRQALLRYATDTRLRIDCEVLEVQAIPVQTVQQVVLNLVQNALEYGRDPVIVYATATPQYVLLRVEDAGEGISPQQWQQAVKPFSRLQDSPGVGHAGLGLALVARLVAACRGSLAAERSERGFVVTVRLAI